MYREAMRIKAAVDLFVKRHSTSTYARNPKRELRDGRV